VVCAAGPFFVLIEWTFSQESLVMPVQVYCTQEDLTAAWTEGDLLAAVDDDSSGTLSATELAVIERAIERAANRMHAVLQVRYATLELLDNAWCRDCNVMLALYLLATRRGEPAPEQIQDQYDAFLTDLEDIRAGRKVVPDVVTRFEHGPTTTNFTVDGRVPLAPVQRVPETSTGASPVTLR
jgi:phage gp36-like protein